MPVPTPENPLSEAFSDLSDPTGGLESSSLPIHPDDSLRQDVQRGRGGTPGGGGAPYDPGYPGMDSPPGNGPRDSFPPNGPFSPGDPASADELRRDYDRLPPGADQGRLPAPTPPRVPAANGEVMLGDLALPTPPQGSIFADAGIDTYGYEPGGDLADDLTETGQRFSGRIGVVTAGGTTIALRGSVGSASGGDSSYGETSLRLELQIPTGSAPDVGQQYQVQVLTALGNEFKQIWDDTLLSMSTVEQENPLQRMLHLQRAYSQMAYVTQLALSVADAAQVMNDDLNTSVIYGLEQNIRHLDGQISALTNGLDTNQRAAMAAFWEGTPIANLLEVDGPGGGVSTGLAGYSARTAAEEVVSDILSR